MVRLFLQYFDKMGYSTRIFWLSMESDHRQTFFEQKFKKKGHAVESSNDLFEIPFFSPLAKKNRTIQACTKFKNTINEHAPKDLV